jgi:ribosome-associated protein
MPRHSRWLDEDDDEPGATPAPPSAEPEPLSVGDRPIVLFQVLKRVGWAAHGAEAKAWVAEGRVRVNGEPELRKRRQMALGDIVTLEDGTSLRLVP